MEMLSEKQLRNLSTERLNSLRKVLVKERAKLEFQAAESGNPTELVHEANEIAEYYDTVKNIMADREHLEKPKDKSKKRSRDTLRGRWDE